MQWLPVYLVGLGVIVFLSDFGPLKNPFIPLWWDTAAVVEDVVVPEEEVLRGAQPNVGVYDSAVPSARRHARRERVRATCVAAVLVLLLSGCSGVDVDVTSGRPPKPTATPNPGGACPTEPAAPSPTGCATYDEQAARRAAGASRQRDQVSAAGREQLAEHRDRIADALGRAAGNGPLDRDGATRVLEPLGYEPASVQGRGRSDLDGGLQLGVFVLRGCVLARVRGQDVRVDVQGPMADGACLAPAQ